ncbi:MAG TPA: hypothetical protein VJ205_00340 [Gammaproteobacteria bacterium]|nr:hypothetical protein [Gammaproteobacteria bacterium]
MKLYIGLKEKAKPAIFESEKEPIRKRNLNTILFMDHLKAKKMQKNTLRPWIAG